jgi:hypothetical protein
MKKLGKKFVYAALLLVLAISGCAFDVPLNTGTAEDPAVASLPPPPDGHVWVKIPLSRSSARTLTAAADSALMNYYEVYFYRAAGAGVQEYLFTGKAGKDEYLVVSVVPNVTYQVLLLAGDSATRTLMASSYTTAQIVSGQINLVDLPLTYVESDPVASATSDFKFTHTDATTVDAVAAAGDWEVTGVTAGGGTGFAAGDLLSMTIAASGGPNDEDIEKVYIRVTNVGAAGAITEAEVVQGGRWVADPSSYTVSNITIETGVGVTTGVTVAIGASNTISDIPKDIPWITYAIGAGGVPRTNPLEFEITTRGLGPLIAAKTAGGGANPELTLMKKAALRLFPLDSGKYDYPIFRGVENVITVFATTDITATADDITITYSLDQDKLPLFTAENGDKANPNTYGALYYILDYYAFGDKGSKWTIRNGIDTSEVDRGEFTKGSGILVKIGNPGQFVSKVSVGVNAD